MKKPIKRVEIYEALKKSIISKEYYPGAKLPKEIDLAQEMGVARKTLRSALAILEEEGLIERLPSKGTFVSKTKKLKLQETVTFLLPCPNFACGNSRSQIITREILQGSMHAATEMKWKLDAVPVSHDNDPDNINWELFDYFDSKSQVVLVSWWYRKLFPMLRDRQCRVTAILPTTPEDHPEYMSALNSWTKLYYKTENAVESAVNYLRSCGCRRIALAAGSLTDKFAPKTMDGYLKSIRNIPDMPENGFVMDMPGTLISDQFKGTFSKFYQEAGFDGLIFDLNLIVDYRFSLNFNLGLPESIKIATLFDFEYNCKLHPQLSASVFPFRQMGYDATKAIISNYWEPQERFYTAMIIKR